MIVGPVPTSASARDQIDGVVFQGAVSDYNLANGTSREGVVALVRRQLDVGFGFI